MSTDPNRIITLRELSDVVAKEERIRKGDVLLSAAELSGLIAAAILVHEMLDKKEPA